MEPVEDQLAKLLKTKIKVRFQVYVATPIDVDKYCFTCKRYFQTRHTLRRHKLTVCPLPKPRREAPIPLDKN